MEVDTTRSRKQRLKSHKSGLTRKRPLSLATAVTVLILAVCHQLVPVETRTDLSDFESSCCPDDTEFQEDGHCFSEEHGIESIHLDCLNGAYLLEREELQNYYISKDGTLFTNDGIRLEYGRLVTGLV